MKSKHFMHWFFGGEKMSKLTEVNLVENIIKKKTPSWIAPNYECEWKEPLGTKKQWIQWIQRDDICYTCDQSIVPTDSFEVSSTFAATCFSFIHSFICAFSDFPINCKGFFSFSVAFQIQWMSINHFQFFAFYMAFLLPISNLGRGKWC